MNSEVNVIVIVGNPKPKSRTLVVGQTVSNRLTNWIKKQGYSANEWSLDLSEIAHIIFHSNSGSVQEWINRVMVSDILIVCSPTFKATYSGLLKSFFDLMPMNGLKNKIAIPVMIGASAFHSLAVDIYLRALLIELGAICPTRGLYLLESQFEDIDNIAKEFIVDSFQKSKNYFYLGGYDNGV